MTNLTDWLLNDGGSKTASAFNFTFNTPLKYYEWIEQPGNEHRLVRFGHAMHGTKQFEIAENIIHGKLSSHVIPPFSIQATRMCAICQRSGAEVSRRIH